MMKFVLRKRGCRHDPKADAVTYQTKGVGPMNLQTREKHTEHVSASRRQHEEVDCLVLRELNPLVVVDHIEGEQNTLTLLTFGNVREACPKCERTSLKLVLRQTSVRMAHLFCAECESCYDAQYADGAPALTI
jgi:hypothetical protein